VSLGFVGTGGRLGLAWGWGRGRGLRGGLAGGMSGWQVPGLAVWVNAEVPGSCVSGRSQCRVAAFSLSGLPESAIFFSTISHCAWRRVISWSLATKKRSKENAFKPRYPKCPQRAVPIHRCPKARCSPEPRMFEPLLLANPDIDTLRHQCPRASTIAQGFVRPVQL